MYRELESESASSKSVPGLLAALLDELFVIEALENYHNALFCTEENRVELLDMCGGTLFAVMQELLLESITIRLARLADSERMRAKETLSLKRFFEKIDTGEIDGSHKDLLCEAINSIKGSVRTLRNERIAHLQLNRIDEPYSYPEVPLLRESIEKCYAFVEAVESDCGIERKLFPQHDEEEEVGKLVEILELGYEQILPRKWWKQHTNA